MPRTIRVTRRFDFAAGHRASPTYDGKCKHLHGHTYLLDVTVEGSSTMLNEHGMLIEFSMLKNAVNDWVNRNLDHTTIVHQNDPIVTDGRTVGIDRFYTMPDGMTSSAEHLASHLLDVV